MYGIYGWWIVRPNNEKSRTNSRIHDKYNHMCCKSNFFIHDMSKEEEKERRRMSQLG